MLENARAITFIATKQPDAARAFYRDTLGLTLLDESEHGMAFLSGESMLRIQIVEDFTPHLFTAAGWAVPDVAATLAALAEKGVAPIRYGHLTQDEAGIWSPDPGVHIAWFHDPDGNTLSLTEFAGG